MQINDIRLIESRFKLNLDNIDSKVELLDVIAETGINFNRDNKELTVFLRIRIEQQDAPFNANIVFGGKFSVDESEADEETIQRISRINCPSIIFPFVREYLADATRRAGVEPLILQPINFVEAAKSATGESIEPGRKACEKE